jgi:uncharacterized protein YceK
MHTRIVTALGAVIVMSGCASVMNDTTQPVKLETAKADGTLVAGADCKWTNDYGTVSGRSGETVQVRRSGKDMDISCKQADNPEATARAISRANAGLAGNILIGGGIGAIIDHTKGTAYTYPTWIRLVFGKSLVFDRSAEKDGQVVQGVEQAASAPAGAASAPAK